MSDKIVVMCDGAKLAIDDRLHNREELTHIVGTNGLPLRGWQVANALAALATPTDTED